MRALTDREREYLAEIEALKAEGFSPTIRELGEALGVRSTNGVAEMLGKLEASGLVTWEHGRCRTLRLTDEGREAVKSLRLQGLGDGA